LDGGFFEPAVLTDVTPDMVITREETFGSVAPLYRFKSEADGVKMANDTPTLTLPRERGREGRGARRLFLQPRHRPHLVRRRALEDGIVGINEGVISTEIAPFGGMKESGIGREASKYGIEEFLEVKYLCMGGIDRYSRMLG
jgi:succinate-semialdehyde dehydrogenase / glutarate-semialdehyde dehydrogenase